ncbi:hypothetical protein B4589_010375 [Halolamina sp. CBA1230]|uniref:hypothetical protein n=1 Tax=Halolamina sp. CBA1230 TaxID=1853690 RepID=UPI0009A1FABF|nr:hypothetical protein [Halolamina sp. CBA1230]QKY20761.1 hypothetical protein B4589_010375 [Halolamina sp. CBA1230]
MQRRAVAVAAALFLIVGALSLGLVLTGETPEMDLPGEDAYQQGDEFSVGGQTYTVASVNSSEEDGETSYEATIEWNNESQNGTQSATVAQHENVTLGEQTYFAHFESGDEVILSDNFDALRQHEASVAQYEEQTNGLWGVSILTGTTLILLLGMAYLPSRY